MRIISIIKFLVILLSCQGAAQEKEEEKRIIYNFIKEFVLDENICLNDSILNHYLSIDQEILNRHDATRKFLITLIQNASTKLRLKLIGNNEEYIVLSKQEVAERNISVQFKSKDYKNIYHVMSNEEIIADIIVRDGKILSFFYGLKKSEKDDNVPWLLNQ